MQSEIFRFMTIRPPQTVDLKTVNQNTVKLNDAHSDFIGSLMEQKKAGSRAGMQKLVQEFIKGNAVDFIDSPKKITPKFLKFYEAVGELEGENFLAAAEAAFIKIFDVRDVQDFRNSGEFTQLSTNVLQSIVIAAIDQNVEAKVRSLLISIAKTLGLIQKLVDRRANRAYSKADFHSQIVLLPEGIFPLPSIKQDVTKLRQAEKERLEKITQNQVQLLALSKELSANRDAINDLTTTFEKSISQPRQANLKKLTNLTVAAPEIIRGGFILTDQDVNGLGSETIAVLKKVGLSTANVDIALATSLIEKQSSKISNKLYANRSSMKYMVKIGNNLIPSDVLLGDMPTKVEDTTLGLDRGNPGVCPPAPIIYENSDEITVPSSIGEGKVLGIADLMVVEQELLRYELGEIAHIENVLKSEIKERTFRTATTAEQSTLTETEVTDEKTKDLSSTERFELQNESEKVISENTSTDAGLTITASYGPSVEATANFNYANSNSRQESNRASSNFARDTTTRATSKVQKRTLERRFVKTVSEVEETNKHGFNNKDGTDNISGVYRFVDKIYHAQIINYGRRLMLEFVVPEPAAFLRYAMTRQPTEGITKIKPEQPGYCKNNNFIALQPQDIDADNYLYWATKYGAEDITPPPIKTKIISGSLLIVAPEKSTSAAADYFGLGELKGLVIPDGYLPIKGVVTVNGEHFPERLGEQFSRVSLQIQNQVITIFDAFAARLTEGLHSLNVKKEFNFDLERAVTDKILLSIDVKNFDNISVLATIFCLVTSEAIQEWQIKTYNSIMNAYNDQKSRYENAMETARIRAGYSLISGTNPFMNRDCEKTELKKGCITLLTAQNFDTFDAMRRNVAPHGYPEIALADAKAEGRYIQFFENAFEWKNMTYVFYPYFWGKKDDWVTISQISDNDPLFTRFLQAGAGRVQVPIRPGFETSLLHYLESGTTWFGEGTLVNVEDGIANPLHLSVLDELKEQLGNQNIEGVGRLTVKKENATVIGSETRFAEADDGNKRIIIKGKTYLIKKVINATEIQLTEKFKDNDETEVRYSMGAKLVGEPWEVKLPTNLVMIDNGFESKISDVLNR